MRKCLTDWLQKIFYKKLNITNAGRTRVKNLLCIFTVNITNTFTLTKNQREQT